MNEKSDRMIMVVDRVSLFADGYFQGFSPVEKMDYERIILDNYHYENRDWAEKNPNLKQPIAYCLIVNLESKKIFAYQRSSKASEYKEKRLRGKWSWGIGGHIDKNDLNEDDPIRASLKREISEEVEIGAMADPKILGYINDDQTAVGQVHFGLLYLIPVDKVDVKPRSSELAFGKFLSIEELDEIVLAQEEPVEEWSIIALGPLREILGKSENLN